MKRYALLLCLALCACGSVDISYHTVTPEQMIAISGAERFGWTKWKKRHGEIYRAKIYMLPRDLYPTDLCYQTTIAHEERHAEEGAWHIGEHSIPECERYWEYPGN